MARPLRYEYANAIYHVTARGNAGQTIFDSDGDKDTFLITLSSVVDRCGWLVYAYCLMNNHYHLVVETPRPNLSSGMRQLNGTWAQWRNQRNDTSGHLFQGRYKGFLIERESYLFEAMRYVLLNPVRAGMCKRPDKYLYSSFISTIKKSRTGDPVSVESILAHFGQTRAQAIREFKSFVYAGIDAKPLFDDLKAQTFLGSDAFVDRHTIDLADELLTEIPRVQRPNPRPPLADLIKHGKDGEGVRNAYNTWDYSQREIAAHMGKHYSTIGRMINKDQLKG